MRVLITGATGMLGTSLVRYFLRQGHEIYGISRGKISRPVFDGEKQLRADITDKASITPLFESVRPEWVIHSAALSDVDRCEAFPQETHRVNSEGSRTVAELSKTHGAFFCYISSDYVFDGEKSEPYVEKDPCNPINVYGKSKWEGEQSTQQLLEQHFIIRTGWLFGEKRDSFVHHVLEWAKTKKEIRLVADKWATPTYTADLAGWIHLLFKKGAPSGIYHLTNGGKGCSWFEYGEKILSCRGIGGISLRTMRLEELNLTAKRPRRSVLSWGKFSRTVGEEPRSWEEALQEYLAKE